MTCAVLISDKVTRWHNSIKKWASQYSIHCNQTLTTNFFTRVIIKTYLRLLLRRFCHSNDNWQEQWSRTNYSSLRTLAMSPQFTSESIFSPNQRIRYLCNPRTKLIYHYSLQCTHSMHQNYLNMAGYLDDNENLWLVVVTTRRSLLQTDFHYYFHMDRIQNEHRQISSSSSPSTHKLKIVSGLGGDLNMWGFNPSRVQTMSRLLTVILLLRHC